jgi:hypothetical protein
LLFPERPHPSCAAEGVKMHLHGQTGGEAGLSDSVGGLSCASCVYTNIYICILVFIFNRIKKGEGQGKESVTLEL